MVESIADEVGVRAEGEELGDLVPTGGPPASAEGAMVPVLDEWEQRLSELEPADWTHAHLVAGARVGNRLGRATGVTQRRTAAAIAAQTAKGSPERRAMMLAIVADAGVPERTLYRWVEAVEAPAEPAPLPNGNEQVRGGSDSEDRNLRAGSKRASKRAAKKTRDEVLEDLRRQARDARADAATARLEARAARAERDQERRRIAQAEEAGADTDETAAALMERRVLDRLREQARAELMGSLGDTMHCRCCPNARGAEDWGA